MKNTQSRSLVGALCAVAVIISTLAVGTSVKGQGYANMNGITIQTYNGITPATIYTNQAGVATIVNGMMSGNPTAGWTLIPNGSTLNISQVFTRNLAGGNYFGNIMNAGVAITSTNPFTMGQIQYSQSSLVTGINSGTFGGSGLTYDLFGVGINYGPDGILGTADDIQYWTGNANTPVNAVYLLGLIETFDTGGLSQGAAIQAWSTSCPVNETISYTLNGVTASTLTTYVVPPVPAILTISALGVGQLQIAVTNGTPGTDNATNVLQSTTDLVHWTSISTNISSSQFFTNIVSATNVMNFYRVYTK